MWFLGAGASVSAGVPTAWDMIWQFKQILYAAQRRVPLSTIAQVSFSGSLGDIRRINNERVVTVKANVDEEKVPGAVARAKAAEILQKFPLPPGYKITFTGEFELSETGDTFIDMSGYAKGMLYVNGHLLGRYWNVGPQQRLYCPASWLKKGKNNVVVFDLLQQQEAEISGHQKMN